MKETTRVKAQLTKISETIRDVESLIGAGSVTKVIASEEKWIEVFGADRGMDINGIPVEFGDVKDAELCVSVEVDSIEKSDAPPAKKSKK
jgi:hypothetical protein